MCLLVTTLFNPAPGDASLDVTILAEVDIVCTNENEVCISLSSSQFLSLFLSLSFFLSLSLSVTFTLFLSDFLSHSRETKQYH